MFERRGHVIDDIHTDRDTYTAKGLKLVALEHENKKRVSLEQKKTIIFRYGSQSRGLWNTQNKRLVFVFFFCYKEGGRIRRLSGTVRRLFIPAKVFRFGTINGAGLILRLSHDAPESNERAY